MYALIRLLEKEMDCKLNFLKSSVNEKWFYCIIEMLKMGR